MSSAPSPKTLDITGVPFEHGGTSYFFSFTWGVFDTLQAEWGDEYAANLASLFTTYDMTHLARVVELTSGHVIGPDSTIPVQPLKNTLYDAYELGWSGRVPTPAKPDGGSEDNGKKPRRSWKFWKVTSKPG